MKEIQLLHFIDIEDDSGQKGEFDKKLAFLQVFVELDELFVGDQNELEWREKARWIKFEEDVEEDAEKWGKPHVASLSFHSLLDLRRCLEKCK